MNELIFVLILLICMLSIFCINKLLPKSGLYMLLIVFIILGFIMSFKITTVFGLNINLNVISYVSIYSIIFILLNNKNKNEHKKIFRISIISITFVVITTLFSCLYIQTVSDNIAVNINNLFLNNYKIIIIYPITLLLEEYLWITLYNKYYDVYESVFITNITSCILLGIVYTIIFTIIGYINILNIQEMINLSLTIYLFRILITICFIPLMYVSKKRVKK